MPAFRRARAALLGIACAWVEVPDAQAQVIALDPQPCRLSCDADHLRENRMRAAVGTYLLGDPASSATPVMKVDLDYFLLDRLGLGLALVTPLATNADFIGGLGADIVAVPLRVALEGASLRFVELEGRASVLDSHRDAGDRTTLAGTATAAVTLWLHEFLSVQIEAGGLWRRGAVVLPILGVSLGFWSPCGTTGLCAPACRGLAPEAARSD